MKKSLVFLLIVSLVLSMAATALAFPLEFNGDFRLRGLMLNDSLIVYMAAPPMYVEAPMLEVKNSSFELRTRLNFVGQVGEKTSLFGRFSNRNYFGGINTSQTEFDHYGLNVTSGDWKFSLGRQAVTLGGGAIISTGYDAAGTTNMFDGLVAKKKAGAFDLTLIGGKTTAANSLSGIPFPLEASEWYGMDLTTKIGDKLSLGGALARETKAPLYQVWATPFAIPSSVNYWAINTNYELSPQITLYGEYVRSNQSLTAKGPTDLTPKSTRAYYLGAKYQWDRDSFTVQYNDVGGQAVDFMNSGIGGMSYPLASEIAGIYAGLGGYRGFTYSYAHQMTKNASFRLSFMDLKSVFGAVSSSGEDTMTLGYRTSIKQFAADVQWKF